MFDGRAPASRALKGTLTGVRATLLVILTLGCLVGPCRQAALAQEYEAVGARALGMGGAFVAVADDASAVYWNPAGLATGRFFSVVFDTSRRAVDDDGTTASRLGTTLAAVGTPPLGLSYYRLTSTAARAGNADGTDPTSGSSAERLRTSHVGVTLVQTLLDGLHLGGTLKYVRGDTAGGSVPGGPDEALDAARTLAHEGSGTFDMDLGLMADFRYVRAGLALRNVLTPEFRTADGGTLTLDRQVRAGIAVLASDALIVTADADLRRVADLAGESRHVAVGVEQRAWRNRLGLRAGVRASTVGPSRTTLTAGGSLAIRTGVYVDGYVAAGVGDRAASGGGGGFRVIF